jgi:hypothetical protein
MRFSKTFSSATPWPREADAGSYTNRRENCFQHLSEALLTDRLSLTNALADANIDRQKAERIATEIFDAIHDSVATKQDLRELELRLDARFEAVGRQIDRVVTRLGALVVVLAGLILAAIRYLPPAGP